MTESIPISVADEVRGVDRAPVLVHQLCFVVRQAIRNSIAVTLARVEPESAVPYPPIAPLAADSDMLEGAKVLVIDDEPSLRAAMREIRR